MSVNGPSLGNITGTNLDSACKHIQQCKVSFDHMILFSEGAEELEKEKMKYCAHKDEVIVGIGRPWKKAKVRTLPPSAYPRIVSNLGNIAKPDEKYSIPRDMIVFLFHYATDVYMRELLVNAMIDPKEFRDVKGENLDPNEHFFRIKDTDNYKDTDKYLDRMYDYYPVGVCNTIAYANPRSGDTVGSVMIGGLRTVMNGDWEVHAGDLVQWYWTFEKDCFRADGTRKSFVTLDENGEISENFMGQDPTIDKKKEEKDAKKRKIDDYDQRRQYNDRQYGMKARSTTPSDKAKAVARIKTYHKDPKFPRIYDGMRILGRAIGTARPGEALDIQINRQSM